jgi:hypothetical protein
MRQYLAPVEPREALEAIYEGFEAEGLWEAVHKVTLSVPTGHSAHAPGRIVERLQSGPARAECPAGRGPAESAHLTAIEHRNLISALWHGAFLAPGTALCREGSSVSNT